MVYIVRRKDYVNYLFLFFSAIILFLGIYLRTGYRITSELWVDELWRANEVLRIDNYLEIEKPITFAEFLSAKIGLFFLGNNELAFRCLAILSSISSLFVFFIITKKIFSKEIALIGTYIFAIAPQYIISGFCFKTYSFEIFLCLLSLLIELYRTELGQKESYLKIGIFILTIFTSSFWIFFTFLPLSLILQRKNSYKFKDILFFIALFIFSFFLNFRYYQTLKLHGEFQFWQDYYLNSLTNLGNILVIQLPILISSAILPLDFYVNSNFYYIGLLVIITIVSPYLMYKIKSPLLIFILYPFAIQILLSIFSLYPLLTRVSSFYYPLLLISFLFFIEQILYKIKNSNCRIGYIVSYSILIVLPLATLHHCRRPTNPGYNTHIEHVKPLLSILEKESNNNDLIILNHFAYLSYEFYKPNNKKDSLIWAIPFGTKEQDLSNFIINIFKQNNSKRIWLLSSFAKEEFLEFEKISKIYQRDFLCRKKVKSMFYPDNNYLLLSDVQIKN